MANNFYGAIGLIGGGTGSLDAIDGALLGDGDGALVIDATNDKVYTYTLNSIIGGSESSPSLIEPDSNAGTKRWVLCATASSINTTLAAVVGQLTADDFTLSDAGMIIWDAAPASDHTGTGIVISQTVNANSYGIASCLVLNSSGTWDEADADNESTVGRLAMALETSTGTKNILLKGIMRNDTWNFTKGAQLFVSATVGEITETAPSTSGQFVQVVGYALTEDVIIFDPSPDYMELT